MSTPRTVLILGSTGSVGTQALDVIRRNRDRFQVVGLGAGGRQLDLLKQQAAEFDVPVVAVANGAEVPGVKTLTSMVDLIEACPADVVLNGMDGSRGLEPSLKVLETGATLALANKESLIAGGSLVLKAAKPDQIVPVDSEHSALAQCLRGGTAHEVHKLVLTASGGPFRGKTRAELEAITVAQAMAHPTWSMGQVVTINSANLVNKGLELIEAHLLFGVPYDRVDVVVHPQSIIHSMVTFTDGSTLAQASPPDMRLPISLGLAWPERVAGAAAACTFDTATSWTFEPVDSVTFPAVELARQAGTAGGCLPAIYNAANEEALASFVAGSTSFLSIVDTIGQVLGEASDWQSDPADVAEVLAAEDWARARARELVGRN
ncbi:1-deoxy-D-xylulose-5-phosphate reductoisomerase [Lentzea sp. BCCO 10_0856]|uniref:1-deoxy-D-xylulose 5-phosphate reductoisomerase n=1 Tax=Lentzea miocenica TaxID=3095431 RepID=A0ABU4TG32_9PSEU|nr:1-deoxy-D-xylulose-5-phosphate reductoisomerase [Lentzea sp. BCCO 10_0856]MDX8037144.1 1-deoxy-D-xylulose-5-phosphate reductoisomerase [Lentzea sp. BCCO 10_0856]